MSTRCNVVIHDQTQRPKAMLYQHCDGHPDRMVPMLDEMLARAVSRLKEFGFHVNNPEKIAGVLVAMSTEDGIPTLQPCLRLHDDTSYVYEVYLTRDFEAEIVVRG